ncbi:MarR family winged helix-turn-helix transcriptional regulator [Paludibaculum fermentans]|uniref:MarR family winged helix-turn-helix transcriptional regulator n=1 Tax=Paludibaculum fermentans TaxID=1473598 RepID=UPI003EBE548D
MPPKAKSEPRPLPDLHCMCANLRRAARLVTQLYSEEMSASLEPAQYSLLTALKVSKSTGQAGLGRMLGLDKTTLSRNLRVLLRRRWIELAGSEDRRERGYRLTAEGDSILAAATPGWQRAQERLRSSLAPGEWDVLMSMFGRVAEAAQAAGSGSKRSSGG